jgi:tetratricopeptide (TPR) repeat protein
LARARNQPDDFGLRLCTALAPSWAIRGRVNEGRTWIDELLRQGAGTEDLRLRASSLARASRLAWRQRDYASARRLLDESLAIGRKLDDPLGVARRLRSLALVALAQGDLDEAGRLCEESITLFRSHGDRYGLGLALAFLGMTLQLSGEAGRADPRVREALNLNRDNGSVTGSFYSLGSMSFGAIAARDMVSLRAHTVEVVGLLRSWAAGTRTRDGCGGPRTVESHVEHIKAKLGFGRRARIVAWALDRQSHNGSRP